MNDDKNNIIYTAKDIEQYLLGKLPAIKMHAMEKAALDDPFLAEAMEGYESVRDKDWSSSLAILHADFEKGNAGAKVITLHQTTGRIWKYAAAAVVIVFGTALSWWLTKEKPNEAGGQQIAQQIKNLVDSVSVNSTTPVSEAETPAFAKTDTKVTVNPGIVKSDKPFPRLDFSTVKADSSFVYIPPKTTAADDLKIIATEKPGEQGQKVADKTITNAITPDNSNIQSTTNVPVQGNVSFEENLKKKSAINTISQKQQMQLNRSFLAQVLGPDNTPLPFANINIKNENFGTYADVKGNFRLVSTDSLLNIEVKADGYLTRNYTLRSSLPQNMIVLKEDDLAFKEKTIIKDNDVSGKKMVSHRVTLLKDSTINVEPADGWDNYSAYIANNIDLPDDLLKKNIKGEVEITFDVKRNGAITNIKVDETNCNNCGAAARRLIEQGPLWKSKKGKKGSAKIKVQF